jgi:hypothetical protein
VSRLDPKKSVSVSVSVRGPASFIVALAHRRTPARARARARGPIRTRPRRRGRPRVEDRGAAYEDEGAMDLCPEGGFRTQPRVKPRVKPRV